MVIRSLGLSLSCFPSKLIADQIKPIGETTADIKTASITNN